MQEQTVFRMLTINPLSPHLYVTFLTDKKVFADVIKLGILRWGDFPGLSEWDRCDHRGLVSGQGREAGQSQRTNSDDSERLEGRHRWDAARAKESRQLEPRRNPALLNLEWSRVGLIWTPGLHCVA